MEVTYYTNLHKIKVPLLHGIEKRKGKRLKSLQNTKFFFAIWDFTQEISK